MIRVHRTIRNSSWVGLVAGMASVCVLLSRSGVAGPQAGPHQRHYEQAVSYHEAMMRETASDGAS